LDSGHGELELTCVRDGNYVLQHSIFTSAPQDARLKEAVTLYKEKEGWRRVAAHVGGGVTGEQCKNRWNLALQHQDKGLRTADWTPEEVRIVGKYKFLGSKRNVLTMCAMQFSIHARV
jgi:hypothetical protein